MNTSTIASLRNKERHVGIDVGKSFLDIAIFELNSHWQVDNTPAGIKGLMAVLKRYKLTRDQWGQDQWGHRINGVRLD